MKINISANADTAVDGIFVLEQTTPITSFTEQFTPESVDLIVDDDKPIFRHYPSGRVEDKYQTWIYKKQYYQLYG